MRRTPLLVAAVSLVAAATPAALLAHGSPSHGPKGDAPHQGKHHPAKHKKSTLDLIHACVTADATETGVDLSVLYANRHARRALDGATTFTATLDANTRIRLVGKARNADERSTRKRSPRIGTWDDLNAGDIVTVRYRVARGTALADLGPARKVTDHGPRPKRCPVAAPTTGTPPAAETPTTTAPGS